MSPQSPNRASAFLDYRILLLSSRRLLHVPGVPMACSTCRLHTQAAYDRLRIGRRALGLGTTRRLRERSVALQFGARSFDVRFKESRD